MYVQIISFFNEQEKILCESNLIPMSKKVCEFIERYLDTTSIQFDIFQ